VFNRTERAWIIFSYNILIVELYCSSIESLSARYDDQHCNIAHQDERYFLLESTSGNVGCRTRLIRFYFSSFIDDKISSMRISSLSNVNLENDMKKDMSMRITSLVIQLLRFSMLNTRRLFINNVNDRNTSVPLRNDDYCRLRSTCILYESDTLWETKRTPFAGE
jgi:hypothetical protein